MRQILCGRDRRTGWKGRTLITLERRLPHVQGFEKHIVKQPGKRLPGGYLGNVSGQVNAEIAVVVEPSWWSEARMAACPPLAR